MHKHPHRRYIVRLLLCLASLMLGGTAAVEASTIAQDPACQDLVLDGGFERGLGWIVNLSGAPAAYVDQPLHGGTAAMRLGIIDDANREAYSSIQQEVTLPTFAEIIVLRFHVLPVSEAPAGSDAQYLALRDPFTGSIIAQPWHVLANDQTWSEVVVDLKPYSGQTLLLYFNVLNDGTGGRTGMYVDDVTLQACTAPTLTPSPTITPTGTPTGSPTPTSPPTWTSTPTPSPAPTPPAGPCQQQCLPNGSFEQHGYWQMGTSPLYPSYVSGRGLLGSSAVLLGNDGQSNVSSYSSVRQDVMIPAWPQSVWLSFWYWPLSEGTDAGDYQELLVLQPQGQQVLARLWRTARDDRRWLHQMVDLTPYQGEVMGVYFNVYNDGSGGRSAMYLDDVCLELCGLVPPPPRPSPTVLYRTPTPTPRRPTSSPTRRSPTSTPTSLRPTSTATWRRPTATPTLVDATATATSQSHARTATPTVTPERVPASVLPVTGIPALPSAVAGWGTLEWVLLALAIMLILAALAALITVLVRQWILPLLARRGQ